MRFLLVASVFALLFGTVAGRADRAAGSEPPDLSRYSMGSLPYDSYTTGRALNGSRNPMPGEERNSRPVVVQPIYVAPPAYVPPPAYYRPPRYRRYTRLPYPYYGPVYPYRSPAYFYRNRGVTVIWQP